MNSEQIMETAIFAGDIMLRSGAETYRVEDTISRILQKAGTKRQEVIVMMTGIVVTITDGDQNIVTSSRRVSNRGTNLTKVGKVNDVSRRYCEDKLTLEEAYEELEAIDRNKYRQYSFLESKAAMGFAVIGFAIMFGGKGTEALAAVAAGIVLASTFYWGTKAGISDLILNPLASFGTTSITIIVRAFLLPNLDYETVIIGALMPLVPGAAITNAFRDTFRGDYISGMARILESFLLATLIAIGVGFGMNLFGTTLIGRGKL